MAEWQRNSLADTGAFKQLAEQGEAAITTVQSVLQIVQGGAEVSKIFLTGIAYPAAVAAAALADALAASLNNYKESGYFLLIIDPTNDSKRSAPIPATSPTLSPTLSAIVAGFRG